MGYYRLHCDQLRLNGVMHHESGPVPYRLLGGELYDASGEELPARFSYSAAGDRPLSAYFSGNCLMHRALVEALQGAGVDNLQLFPTVLTEEATGAVREDYWLVNVLGLVAAADMKQSQGISLGGGQVFTQLTIDPGRTHGLLMFRLAESLVDVIVHERVAEAVRAGGFPAVLLTPVTAA